MKTERRRSQSRRIQVADLAAKLITEGATTSYAMARRKAAQQLRVKDTVCLPTNREIESALVSYQQLFLADRQARRIADLRRQALQAMRLLRSFDPQLVGSVLKGTACDQSAIELHLYAGTPEDVGLFLLDNSIAHSLDDKRLLANSGSFQQFPVYLFCVQNTEFQLIVFSFTEQRHPPLSTIDGRPMERANANAVEILLSSPMMALGLTQQ